MKIFDNIFRRCRQHPDLASEVMRVFPGAQVYKEAVSPQNEQVLQFLRGEDVPNCCHSLESIVNYTDEEMEQYHDFIQWIYPTLEQSQAHPDAPIIDTSFADKLHKDACALAGYCKGCKRYLQYMGLECKSEGEIIQIPNAQPFWKLPSHNYLRITRALNSLDQTKHSKCNKALYSRMMQILDADPTNYVGRTTLGYWERTQKLSSEENINLSN